MEKRKELYTKYKEVINYLIFGVLTTIVSLATKYLLLFTILVLILLVIIVLKLSFKLYLFSIIKLYKSTWLIDII